MEDKNVLVQCLMMLLSFTNGFALCMLVYYVILNTFYKTSQKTPSLFCVWNSHGTWDTVCHVACGRSYTSMLVVFIMARLHRCFASLISIVLAVWPNWKWMICQELGFHSAS